MFPNNARCEREGAAQRRQQVLAAAADCFRRNGFHNAGMAQIARAAGMSVGHIYHYFENKEAIIAAIVDADLARIIGILENFAAQTDILAAMVARCEASIDEHINADDSYLQLEIFAESARNPSVAELTRAKDAVARQLLRDTIANGRRQRGLAALAEAELSARVEVLIALFNGLGCRGVANPGLDRAAVSAVLTRTMRQLLED